MKLPPITTRLDHRGGLLPHGTPSYPPPCFDRLGSFGVSQLVDTLYDGIESDPVLLPAFNRDLTLERQSQKSFFTAWFGGPRSYFDGWHPGLLQQHEKISISQGMADRWLGHFRRALSSAGADSALAEQVMPFAEQIAYALVSRSSEPSKGERLRGSCSTVEIRRAEGALASGDDDELHQILHFDPIALRRHGPRLLVTVAARGLVDAVNALLAQGLDPNFAVHFSPTDAGARGLPIVPVTSLCAAAIRNRQQVCDALAGHGAQYDIFSAICLGDHIAIERALDLDPSLATASDPADDFAEITTLYHAVLAGRIEIVRLLIDRGAVVGANSVRLVEMAANAGNEALTDLLLDNSATTAALTIGGWVTHPGIATKLLARGADINREPGKWIGNCCTGNSGHREDLPLARALLDCGADISATYRGRSALHHAAQAGFTRVIELLVQRGADPNALDEKGRTPLDAVDGAAKTIDRNKTRTTLQSLGARG